MSVCGPCIALLRERIRSLQSPGIDKIWMKVSGDDDWTMANILGFLNADFILLLKTTGLMNANNSINIMNTWDTRIGIPMEWDRYKSANWCRFKFESKYKSSPSGNTGALLNQFNAAKTMDGSGSARRKTFDAPDVRVEINQYLAQQPERSSLSSVSIIAASLSASEKSTLVKKAADAAELGEQRQMRQLESDKSLLELFHERDAAEQDEVFQECLRRRVQSKANFVTLQSLNGKSVKFTRFPVV